MNVDSPPPDLKDPDGEVAPAYRAICTPHAFVFDAVLEGRALALSVTDPFGCAIVW
ncbi:MAG: hypothetical protein ACRDZM_09350 [Acidimicrobiia bacterium]